MLDTKGDKASNIPVSGIDVHQGMPVPQHSRSSTESAIAQAIYIAQSRPRRAAAASAFSFIESGVAGIHRRRTATSTAADNSGVSEEYSSTPLYGPDGEIWVHRHLPKLLQDVIQPISTKAASAKAANKRSQNPVATTEVAADHGRTATSMAADNSGVSEEYSSTLLYGPDGEIWVHRPLPKLLQDMIQPTSTKAASAKAAG
jgi:hypothetical protein